MTDPRTDDTDTESETPAPSGAPDAPATEPDVDELDPAALARAVVDRRGY